MTSDQSTGGATEETSGQIQEVADDSEASGKKNHVAYETYKKTLSEAKRLKEQLKAQQDALQKAQEEKLSAEGKKDELIAQLQKKAQTLEAEKREQMSRYVQSQLSVQIREEARALGVIDPDDAVHAVDLSTVEVDENTFQANKDQLKDAISGLKKSKPHWFSKAGPKINSELPGAGLRTEKKEYKDMSKDELWAELRKTKG